jgi:uncharacterized protein
MTLAEEKYVAVTTFRKSGAGVSTPTWIVALDDGRLGFWTSSASGKVKRLRNSPALSLQPADARGRVKAGSAPVSGTAEVVSAGADFDAIRGKVKAKYGAMVHITKFLSKVGHIGKGPFPYGDTGIIITLPPATPGDA